MIVAGVMSGTSADGVDVALARISPGLSAPTVEVLGHREFSYEAGLRERVLAAMDAQTMPVAELARLSWRLGEVYADAIEKTCQGLLVRPELVGMHGQTIYHQAAASEYAGAPTRATWQIGEAAVVRERLDLPVVSDLRAADLAAGGQGAPLVAMADFCLFGSAETGRVLLNLGGIANVTVLPAGCALEELSAFDTGPANMVIDALMQEVEGRGYDEGGALGASGVASREAVEILLRDPYFSAPPPKSCGREQFGQGFVRLLVKTCNELGAHSGADLVATATEVTVQSIAASVRGYGRGATEVIAAGGGVRNAFLMRRLAEELGGVRLRTAEELGVASQAKEAVAFALLAWLSWFGLPGNVSSATGARGARVLGKISW